MYHQIAHNRRFRVEPGHTTLILPSCVTFHNSIIIHTYCTHSSHTDIHNLPKHYQPPSNLQNVLKHNINSLVFSSPIINMPQPFMNRTMSCSQLNIQHESLHYLPEMGRVMIPLSSSKHSLLMLAHSSEKSTYSHCLLHTCGNRGATSLQAAFYLRQPRNLFITSYLT